VAKRSVRRERQRVQQGEHVSSSQPPPAPAYRSRTFWLGAVAAAALLIPLGIVGAVIASSGDDGSPSGAAATRNEKIAAEAEKLRQQARERDKQQVQELTDRMRKMLGELGPAVRGLATTVPPEQHGIGPLAGPDAVEKWSGATREAAKYFEDPPSGETDTNVARLAFAAAVDQLVGAVDTYRLALDDSAHRRALLERVREERDLAVQTWFIGGTELDAVNHKYGFGHNHIYLAPEGSGKPGDLQTG
jgi:hypothetical protein